ncbi:phosphoenolpyruvate carboxylase 4-like [Rosa rugosa]|uniref:phosphoenolpyruvate carboxylase 4-like n=1 Tax=Rosa rugosa TaxID=74645 RepID=UPI002B402C3B|nr:phosphoenolpyruvate carboxylase 4-like [Rosa rugosa]
MRLAGMEDTAELLEKKLASEISKMSLEEALTLAPVFSHYLNLMGIAEVHHRVCRQKNVNLVMVFLFSFCSVVFPQTNFTILFASRRSRLFLLHILHKLIAEPYNTNISDFLIF